MSVPVDDVEAFAVVAPAGTLRSAPLEVQTNFGVGTVTRIEIDVPDGHAGLTGIYLALAHGRMLPRTQGAFITANDAHLGWDLIRQPDSGAWSAFVYNTDVFAHTFYVRFSVIQIVADTDAVNEPHATTPAFV